MKNHFDYALIFVLTVIISGQINAQLNLSKPYFNEIRIADSLFSVNDFKRSKELFQKAFEVNRSQSNLIYLAKCYIELDQKDSALAFLYSNSDIPAFDCTKIEYSDDLVLLHKYEEWHDILRKCQNANESISKVDSVLRKELIEMKTKEQSERKKIRSILDRFGDNSSQMDSLREVINTIDSQNMIKLDSIIRVHGFPGRSLVGDAYSSAFLIIQHSSINEHLEYFKQIKELCLSGELPKKYIAFLTDRILMEQGKDQLFGTQTTWDATRQKFQLLRVNDLMNIEYIRNEYELFPLESYLRMNDILMYTDH